MWWGVWGGGRAVGGLTNFGPSLASTEFQGNLRIVEVGGGIY